MKQVMQTYHASNTAMVFDSCFFGFLVGVGTASIIAYLGGDMVLRVCAGGIVGSYTAWAQYKNTRAIEAARILIAGGN